VLRQASETGQLFGSVSPRDLVTSSAMPVSGSIAVKSRSNAPIKTNRSAQSADLAASEVESTVTVIVARSEDEAARIARGENLTQLRETTEAEAAIIAAEEFFEPRSRRGVAPGR